MLCLVVKGTPSERPVVGSSTRRLKDLGLELADFALNENSIYMSEFIIWVSQYMSP